ncbi:MAG: LysR family transcriptional regulator [Jatrophihabitans sp.]
MLDPIHLDTLRTVLRTGSFSAAANELQYTPSAVSQQMSALERACGTDLFERLPHQVRPTPAALALAERAADILAGLAAAEAEVGHIARGDAGLLRVGSFPTAGATLLPRALAQLRRVRPGVEIELIEAEPHALLPRVRDGDLDLALIYEYDLVPDPSLPGLMRVPLLHERLRVLQPSRGQGASSAGDPVRLSRLRDQRFVAPLAGSAGAVNLDRMCAAAGFTPRVAFRSNDYSVVRGLVGAGLGVAVVPDLAVVRDRTVVAATLAGRAPRRHVYAVHRQRGRSPLLAAALEAVAMAAQRLVGE